MHRFLSFALLSLAACGGSGNGITPAPKKPDPYVTIRVSDLMDTTTAPGRAHWHAYLMLTGPYTALNGIAYQGNYGLNDRQLNHNIRCTSVSADSVGQRLLSFTAFADTTTDQLTAEDQFTAYSEVWYSGNHTLPNGWMVLTFPPVDAWQSAQYLAGHGLTPSDPVKWDLTWTGAGVVTFTERTDSDPQCATAF
jgi:hypothetical protein